MRPPSTAVATVVRGAPVRERATRWRDENQQLAVVARLLRTRKGVIGTASLVALVLRAVFSPIVAPYDPNLLHLDAQLAPPSRTYWFGTDELGRDILSRVILATRPAIRAGLSAVVLAAVVGTLTGLLAGYLGGWFDSIVMRIWDALLAFPSIFLAIGIVTILGPGWINAVIAISIINMPVFSRSCAPPRGRRRRRTTPRRRWRSVAPNGGCSATTSSPTA